MISAPSSGTPCRRMRPKATRGAATCRSSCCASVTPTPARQPVRYPAFTKAETRQANDEQGLQPSLKNLLYAVSVKWQQPCDNGDCTEKCVAGMDCSDEAASFMNLQSPPFNLFGRSAPDRDELPGRHAGHRLPDCQPTYARWRPGLRSCRPPGHGNRQCDVCGPRPELEHEEERLLQSLQIELKDTANEFASGVLTDTAKLFVYYFARSCAGLAAYTSGHCREIPENEIPVCTDPAGAGCDKLTISLRDYIKPGTQRGRHGADAASDGAQAA